MQMNTCRNQKPLEQSREACTCTCRCYMFVTPVVTVFTRVNIHVHLLRVGYWRTCSISTDYISNMCTCLALC